MINRCSEGLTLMEKRVKIFDTTLRDGTLGSGFLMNLDEKLELARQLELMRVDIIEGGYAAASEMDMAALKAIAKDVKDVTISSYSRATRKEIEAAWEALSGAESARINLVLPTSALYMERLHLTREQVLQATRESITYAGRFFSDVQFSAEDAGRSDWNFLSDVFNLAVKSGASTINIPDTVGYITPTEMYAMIKFIRENIDSEVKPDISIHCHNDMGLGTANSLGGIAAGATQIEGTIGGIGERAGNTALEEVIIALMNRRNYYGVDCRVNTRQIYRTSRLLQTITGVPIHPNKPIVGQNIFHSALSEPSGQPKNNGASVIVSPEMIGWQTNKSDTLLHHSAFENRLNYLGYHLDHASLKQAYEKFRSLLKKDKDLTDEDLEAMLGSMQWKKNARYFLESFTINSVSDMQTTAVVKLKQDGKIVQQAAMAHCPVQAAFKAINQAAGEDFLLESYTLNKIGEGERMMNEALLRIGKEGQTVTGRGISANMLEAGIRAYLSAVNKFFLLG